MVLKNKEDCSFSAFHGLFVPRAPRSARRRGHFNKKVEDSDGQICAFELLASLANELLQDTKSSTALNDASRRHDQPAIGDDVFWYNQGKENLLKVECIDQGRCEESVSIPEFIAPKSDEICNLMESSYAGCDLTVQHNSGSLEKVYHGLKPVINSQNLGDDCFSKVDTGSLIFEKDTSITDGFCRPQHSDDQKGDGLAINDIPSANDPAKLEIEFPALINKENTVEVPSHGVPVHNASVARLGDDLKLGITDDDENFRIGIRDDENFREVIRDDDKNLRDDLILGCRDDDEDFRNDLQVVIREDDGIFSRHNKPGTMSLTSSIRDDNEKFARGNNYSNRPRAFRYLSRVGARRIKNLLSSKCWKSSPKWKDCELPKVAFFDGGMKPLFCKRKIHHSRERYLRETLNKRRKLANRRFFVTSGRGFSSKRVFNSPENRMHVDKNDFAAVFNEENEMSSPTIGHQTFFGSKDSHVKFCIKSFRIPELLIEVPETTTVGSLKRTVMETLMAVLGSSLHVGMLLHGKKVRDDNRTLLQTGMTSKENLDTLGFTLEPTVCTKNPIIPLSYDTSQLASRPAAPPVFNSGISDALPGPSPLISSGDNARSYHELASSCADKLSDKTMPDSRALVSVAPVSAYLCGVVPVNHRTRQPEHIQRRARRPFSVSEVELLVQAVERFGTGRWRDVKLLYFQTADHRTYVDLKDKWKTLVHTAQIPPQQRRGEPVPQELLDRVLAAHAYWSLQQAKQQYTN